MIANPLEQLYVPISFGVRALHHMCVNISVCVCVRVYTNAYWIV